MTEPDYPRVSVIVPTYGRPRSVRLCIEALSKSDYPGKSLEIIVVDDGSPEPVELDDVPFSGTLRLLRRQENRGPAAARNFGAEEASGDILAFTDDDCRPHRGWVRALAAEVEHAPDSLAGGVTVNGLAHNVFSAASQDLIDFLYGAFAGSRQLRPFFTSNNFAVERSRFRAVGGFNESFRFSAGEDRAFSERWAAHVGRLRLVETARVDHHHDLSLGSFLRQHFRYGRGAVHLAWLRRLEGEPTLRPEPLVFYVRMLRHPFRGRPFGMGVRLAGLIALAQVSGVLGMTVENVRPGNERTPRT